jgi:hypothetical protein
MSLVVSSPEDMILLYCSRTDVEHNTFEKVNSALNDDLDWNYIVSNAQQHGISELLYYNLSKNDYNNLVPENVLNYLKKQYYTNVARNMLFYQDLNKVLTGLKDAKIDVIILKGGALAETVYPDIGLRPFSDIDILVQEKDLQRAKEVVSFSGYVLDECVSPEAHNEEFGCDLHYVNKKFVLEIHWHIVRKTGNDRYTRIQIDELWKRAIPAKIANVDVLVFSPDDLLLHLCIHLPRHRYNRLIWFCDISEVIRRCDVDWPRFVKNARKYRTIAYMYYGLYFTDKLLDCGVPANVLDELKPFHFETKVFESIPNDLLPDKKNVLQVNPLLKLLLIDRKWDRFRYLWEYVFPPYGVLARSYSTSGPRVYLFYLIHPVNLGFKSIKRLLAIAGFKR